MNSTVSSTSRKPWWLAVALLIASVWTFAACGSSSDEGSDAVPDKSTTSANFPNGTSSGGTATGNDTSPSAGGSSSGNSSGAGSESGSSTSGSSGGSSSGGSTSGDNGGSTSGAPVPVPVPLPVPGATDANLKVAFLGDTNAGQDFKDVLELVKREGVDLVVFQGDLTYAPTTSAQWLSVADGALDNATTKIPYFAARGNHDTDWKTIGEGLDSRFAKWGIATEHNKPSVSNYSVVFKGLKLVFADDTETSNPTRTDYVKERLAGDDHLWKVCSWHRNMKNTQAGGKGDEMPWAMYEACREAGAIVAQGHSHTYSRSKTMSADQALTVDPACSDPFALCVGPGKHFFFDSSVGGVGLRTLENGDKPHFASSYSSDYGALFIEFNVDGDARKARGYFKTVADVVIDPPQGSGKTSFTITSSN